VTIAAQACILLLHRETEFYPGLDSILVYPHAYVAPVRQRRPDGTVLEGVQPRLGESWARGAVVLSWDDVVAGAADIHDGHNVVLHEFAHSLITVRLRRRRALPPLDVRGLGASAGRRVRPVCRRRRPPSPPPCWIYGAAIR
jgi:Mlc titration factor MtfA (ptsG expression regulator)